MKTLGKDGILSRLLPCTLVFHILITFFQFREPCVRLSDNNAKVTVAWNYNPLKKVSEFHYEPSMLENYFIVNFKVLGLHINNRTRTCPLIFNASSPMNNDIHAYFSELDNYIYLMKNFTPVEHDLRKSIKNDGSNIKKVCSVTKIHPDGLGGVFAEGHASISNTMGAMEPLLLVFQSPKICVDAQSHLMSMEYLVHDFYSMLYINQIFCHFAFHFDHIYAYEIKEGPSARAYELVPDELMDSFHWMNVGVDPELGAKLNPFTTLLSKFNSDDFIVVKLDIDTPSIENRLALQLRNDDKLLELVDLVYFEDHRLQEELLLWWRRSANGRIGGSLELMAGMRAHAIASHYWP
ncbi:hypothetical protein HJC23_003747 [Cyclotella cryptica]|uniref:Uncharacterized protein n=1 Tax=Cyclotella cryptica TaxID=29204 RepID=A0ABD3QU19_9STRA